MYRYYKDDRKYFLRYTLFSVLDVGTCSLIASVTWSPLKQLRFWSSMTHIWRLRTITEQILFLSVVVHVLSAAEHEELGLLTLIDLFPSSEQT